MSQQNAKHISRCDCCGKFTSDSVNESYMDPATNIGVIYRRSICAKCDNVEYWEDVERQCGIEVY